MSLGLYILGGPDGRTPIQEPDVIKWGRWFETAKRHVANTQVGPLWVSTVFLGLDHSFGSGPPVLFETMLFGPEEDSKIFGKVREIRPDLDCRRYHTWEEAEHGHAVFVEQARQMVAEADAFLTRVCP